jgi:Flp pilus assembly protein TadG
MPDDRSVPVRRRTPSRPPRLTLRPSGFLRRKRSRGQALVEFALVLPLFALVLLMTIDFGRVFFSYIQINNAAREAAAMAAISPTDDVAIEARALAETNAQSQAGESPLDIVTECENATGTSIDCADSPAGAGAGNRVTVAVSEDFSFLTPFVNNFFANDFSMSSTATATVLGYAAGAGGSNPGSCASPSPTFTVIVTSGLSIHVDPAGSVPNTAPCTISGYNWTWGDGTDDVGSATGDDHTYTSAGTYTITLETTNQAGAATTTRTVTVPVGPPPPTCEKPTADFTFTDRSTVADPVNCPLTNWLWEFDDGTQSNAQNPTHTYQTGGTHTATLVATNAGGASNPVTH